MHPHAEDDRVSTRLRDLKHDRKEEKRSTLHDTFNYSSTLRREFEQLALRLIGDDPDDLSEDPDTLSQCAQRKRILLEATENEDGRIAFRPLKRSSLRANFPRVL